MGTNYYVRTPGCANACEHCSESQRLHLGKTSAGWQLLFQADSDWAPDQVMAEWMKLAESGPIEDEYGRPCTLPEFLAMADNRRDLRSHLEPQPGLGLNRYPTPPGYYIKVDGNEFCTRYFS